jgi:protein-S-isoprenylcysteine O-methyltransferase Ste14
MAEVRRVLAFWAVLPAGATLYFFLFWRWFDYWRLRRMLWYGLLLASFGIVGLPAYLLRRWTLGWRFHLPLAVEVLGWTLLAAVTVFGWIADRQIGFRVRSFRPFFEQSPRIDLKTTGAYGVVRHPIYAAGSVFQIAIFLVTGYPIVLASWVVFTLGAQWFTRQEERRLVELLDDPDDYTSYRARVPALFPRLPRR